MGPSFAGPDIFRDDYADATLEPEAALPVATTHEERAIYVVSGLADIGGDQFPSGQWSSNRFAHQESNGATAIEYGLIISESIIVSVGRRVNLARQLLVPNFEIRITHLLHLCCAARRLTSPSIPSNKGADQCQLICTPCRRGHGEAEDRRDMLRSHEPITVRNPGHEVLRMAIVGGEPMDGPRYIWWNFIASQRERIEQPKADWNRDRFGMVMPGDDEEIHSFA